MKHNSKITIILISMFIITQLIGLAVIKFYQNGNELPYGMEPPEKPEDSEGLGFLYSILIAFVFAIFIFFILTKINAEKFIRLWFFAVTMIAIGLTLNAVLFKLNPRFANLGFAGFISLIIALPLAYTKIFKRDVIVHNVTELMIYPGIAAVFVPILGIMGIIILLLVISLYDMWAVWKSQFMQKMAKYQMENLKIFGGFFIPYANKKQRKKLQFLKEKYKGKSEKTKERAFKKANIKVSLAILGGGDVIFPIITAGVFYKVYMNTAGTLGGILPALIITASATIGILSLFVMAKKKKYYPAMPFLTISMYIGMIVNWLVF